jgi:uncharacterized protein YbjT (DUF2867 family)
VRILLTGAGNPVGAEVARQLVAAGHQVRAFGCAREAAEAVGAMWFPGDLKVGGSIEPALSEREVLIHAACLDGPGKDATAHRNLIERGTLYARYGAEREQVDHFVHLAPAASPHKYLRSQQKAVEAAKAARGPMQVTVLEVSDPQEAARKVLAALASKPMLGKQPGRDTDAVTA